MGHDLASRFLALFDDAVDYSSLYSGGIGYAYLAGGNTGLIRIQLFATTYRFGLNKIFAFTGDVQYVTPLALAGRSWICSNRDSYGNG